MRSGRRRTARHRVGCSIISACRPKRLPRRRSAIATSIPDRFKWNLKNIFPDWDAWQAAYDELDRKIDAFAALQGTLGQGGEHAAARR